jgi:putative transposase
MNKGLSYYHLIIIPKYRHKIFENSNIRLYTNDLIMNLNHKKYTIIDFSIEIDHIHFCLHIKPTIETCKVVKDIKQKLGYHIFYKYKNLKHKLFQKSKLWTKGYYLSSIGNVSKSKVLNYIKSQELYEKSKQVI